jgi:hypothetical protein
MFKKLKCFPVIVLIILLTIAIFGSVFVIRSLVLEEVNDEVSSSEIFYKDSYEMEVELENIQPPASEVFLPLMLQQKKAGNLNLLTLNKLTEKDVEAQISMAHSWEEANGDFNFALSTAFTDLYDVHFQKDNKIASFTVNDIEAPENLNGIVVTATITDMQGHLDTDELHQFFKDHENEMFKRFKENLLMMMRK